MDFLRQKLGFGSHHHEPSVHDIYTFGKPVGEGAFSVVRLAKNSQSGEDVAIKCINRKDLSPEDEQSIRSEINIMTSLDHPHIVKFLQSFEEDKFFYVVLEFLPGGELFDRLVHKTFYTEEEARDTVRVICEGIKYCHDRGIVHRDLKPENLLMGSTDPTDNSNVKIADFGFATRATGASLTVACGTPGYVAPELVSNKPYGKAVDMWAIGVITYCLLGGYPPFDAETDKLLFRKIRKGEYEFHPQFWNHVSSDAKNFISCLLQLDPETRYTADQALAHPWLNESGTNLAQIDLTPTISKLKSYQASRKFKGAARALMAVNRLTAFTRASSSADDKKISAAAAAAPVEGEATPDEGVPDAVASNDEGDVDHPPATESDHSEA